MDHKPLLQERPPAYNLEAGQGDFACGPHGYGAIPAAAPPPPYPYLVTGLPTHHPRVYNIHSRNVTRYPANSIVVVGGCPVCRYVMGLGAPETSKNTLTQTHKGRIVWRHGQSWDRLLTGAWERVGSVV
uniref:Membrane protein BRI3 n=1 Tax=Balaenoptera musculus TaxID=9771 RepID=A0A8C0DNG9_BALMU